LLFADYTGRVSVLSSNLYSTVNANDSNVSNFVNINKYTDDKVKTVLSASAGNYMTWNNATKQFDVTFDGNYNSLTNKLTAGNNVTIDGNNVVSANLNSYNGTATINGDLVVNSNLIVSGAMTTLNTDVYTTEKLDITNVGSGPSLSIKQTSQTNNIFNVSNYANSEVFSITKDGYINFTERINSIDVTQFSKIANIDSNDTNVSNYVRTASNVLFADYTGRISSLSSALTNDTNVSNYVRTASNVLFSDYVARDNFTSNFIRGSSNLLFADYTGRISSLSSALTSTISTNDTNVSNYVRTASNVLFSDYVARDNFTSNFIRGSSNLLFADYVARDNFTSNFIRGSSNLLFADYTGRVSTLSSGLTSTISTNDANVSNFVNINKYTDDKVKTVLSASAGNYMTWNNTTKQFDVSFNGDYNSLTNKLTAGNNVTIDGNNVVSANLNSYNGTATINGDLVVNSNLIVSGSMTTLNTDVYTTEKLDITNVGSGPSLSIKQTSQTNNIFNVSNYANSEVFNITKDGYINFTERINGINVTQFSKIANIDSNDANVSNYVRIASNVLFTDYTGRVSALSSAVSTNDANVSNYVRIASNVLFTDYSGRVSALSSAVSTNDANVSNYVRDSSNFLKSQIDTKSYNTLLDKLTAGTNISIVSNAINNTYSLPIATANDLGGFKVGSGLTINSSTGVLDVTGGGGSSQWTTSGTHIYNNNAANVGIGTTNPTAYKLQVVGTIGASGNIVASYSDERLKHVTEYIKDVLPILDKINVFRYNCNDVGAKYGYDKNKKELGLSAQEIQRYYPELVSMAPFDSEYDEETQQIVSKSGENYITICYERLVPVLIQGIKELNNVTTSQENRINTLEARLEKLEKIIDNSL
jgi:hypothetical protein